MASGHDGLVNAVRGLYLNPEFSDLNLVSSYRKYPVHKALVCSQSPYLADKCRDPEFAATGNTIELKEDDPQALHLIVEYLYNLDYTDALPDDLLHFQPPNSHAGCTDLEGASTLDGFTPESPVVVTNGFEHPESPQPPAPLEETPQPEAEGAPLAENDLDDFLPIKTPTSTTKKKKGKKGKNARAKSISEAAPEPATEPKPEDDSRQFDTPTPVEPPPLAPEQPQQSQTSQPYLTTHAKLYSLSAKYGISPLTSLALSKFQSRASSEWDANDFVHAAREVYSSRLLREESHAEMRRTVTGLVFGHRELLDLDSEGPAGVRGILRGELGLDLILRFREEGVW
ncbi:hypothetical protein B0T14DRAFT_567371 [Immersiella caudata]|uniref:BTB domain-containing protein n=1 Tax=Immersiella caudata TaxID=314043 RepID=A0AA39WS82_9PEZI|nr:hypothetical protein B0T14DRAFT_567371 [Immersiella caudata]